MTTYYGFTNSNRADEPAWFHTPAAAQRFAAACGWGDVVIETIETIDNPPPDDVLDTPECPWGDEEGA